MIAIKSIKVLLALLLCLQAQAVMACMVPAQMDPHDIVDADVVVVGEIIGYERINHSEIESIYSYATLVYRVDEALKGKPEGEIEALWFNSTFGVPEEGPIGKRVIVGLMGIMGKDGSKMYRVQQMPCAPPVSFPASSANIEAVKGWLSSGVAEPGELDFYVIESAPIEIPAQEKAPFGEWKLLLGVVLLSILLAAVFSIFRLRRGAGT